MEEILTGNAKLRFSKLTFNYGGGVIIQFPSSRVSLLKCPRQVTFCQFINNISLYATLYKSIDPIQQTECMYFKEKNVNAHMQWLGAIGIIKNIVSKYQNMT